jgi:predicted dehydrogenase
MSDLRCAVFGAGFWSRFQIPAWLEIEGVQLVALYNRTRSKAEALAEKWGIPAVYDDPEELLRKERPDFVDIITHEVTHAPLVDLAAQYGLPVICQKPMGPDYPTCVEMVRRCHEAGVPFMIHENFRYQRTMRAVKQALDEGRIGSPYRARIQLGHGTLEQVSNQPFMKELEHWALTDMGSHALDLARFFFGEAQSLYCQIHRSHKWEGAIGEDIVSVMLRMGEVICVCELGWVDNPIVFIEGTLGTLELRTDDHLTITTDSGVVSRRIFYPWYTWADPSYGPCHPSIVDCSADLLRAIKTGQPPETSGDDNLRTIQLVFAAYDSAERNQVITFDTPA